MREVIAGRYEPLEELGRGGMGTVWRAHDRVLDREVAVKEVRPPTGLGDDEIAKVYARTFREARSAARLDHPGIVTVHDVVEEDGRPWIVMQFVRAKSLDAAIKGDGPLPPARVAAIGLDLLDALRTAHAAGVVHRDVKPGNVLLPPNRAVLTDFGIATVAGDDTITRTGAIVGSPAYLAPEQARRQKATPASDLWSLGATLYAAVEGQPPYKRPDVWGVMGALLSEEPDPPQHAGPLTPVLRGLLRKDPAERIGPDEAERLLRAAAAAWANPTPPPMPVPMPPAHATMPPFEAPTEPPTGPPQVTVPPGTGGGNVRWPVIVPLGVFGVLLAASVITGVLFLNSDNEGTPGRAGATGTQAVQSPGGGGGGASTAPDSTTVPAGYERYEGSAFVVAVPKGWKAEAAGDDVSFTDPSGKKRGIFVSRVAEYAADLGGALANVADGFKKEYNDYKQVNFDRTVPYQGGNAAELEFTFVEEGGTPGRLRARLFHFDDAVYMAFLLTSQDQWKPSAPYFETFLATFRAG